MTQMQLAAGLGLAQNTIAQWESEISLPRTRQLPALARVLGVTISELFEDPAAGAFETDSGQWSFGGPFAGADRAEVPDDTSLSRKEAARHGV